MIQSSISFPAGRLQLILKNISDKLVDVVEFLIRTGLNALVSTLRSSLTLRASRGKPPKLLITLNAKVKKGAPRSLWRSGAVFGKIFLMYYAYILQLKDGSYYHGSFGNLRQRLTEHQRGIVPSTKNLRPVKLIFYAAFLSKEKAMEFEKYLKSSSGFAFRNKRLI